MIVLLLTSFNVSSQINLSDAQARRVLEKLDSLDVCRDEVQSVRAENELYERRIAKFKDEADLLRKSITEAEKASDSYRNAAEANAKALTRQEARTLFWQIATPAALVVGYLLAK